MCLKETFHSFFVQERNDLFIHLLIEIKIPPILKIQIDPFPSFTLLIQTFQLQPITTSPLQQLQFRRVNTISRAFW